MLNAPPQHDAPIRVLIIDDTYENRYLLALHLQQSGYHYLEAASGLEGLALARQAQPDLILLDVMMPETDGFEVCRQLKADPLTQHIPIIIVSALSDVSFRIQGIEVGADEFLSRPYNRDELLVRVRSLVQLRRTRRALQREHDKLQLLYNVSQAIMGYLNLNQIIDAMVEAMEAYWLEAKAYILILDGKGKATHHVLAPPHRAPRLADRVADIIMHRGFAGWVVRHKQGDIIVDIQQDARWLHLPGQSNAVRSAVAAPLVRADTVIGVLMLTHPQPGYFQPEHMELLQAIASQAMTVIQSARYFDETNEKRLKLEALLNQSSDAVITTDEEFRLTRVNRSAETLFAVREPDLLGRSLIDIPQFIPFLPLFEQARRQPVTTEVALENGRILYSSLSLVPGAGYLAVLQDVTDLKEVERQRLEMERRERLRLRDTFGRYVSPRLVEHILADDAAILARRERRWVVVLFADLRNFTEMLTRIPAGIAIELLNEFFDSMIEVIYAHEGTVFDLIGDELEVGFNVPLDQPDAVQRAVRTALEMQHHFWQRQADWSLRAGTRLGLGIGIDLGYVLIGNVGARTHMNYAMVGEAVNKAHRLVDLADNGDIILSQAVYQAWQPLADGAGIEFQMSGPLKIKGITEPQLVYMARVEASLRERMPV